MNGLTPEEYLELVLFHENRISRDQQQLRVKRDALVDDIRLSFDDVTRKGGISLAEVEYMDAGAPQKTCLRIRSQQRDKHWSEVNLREHDPQGSGICFLDPIGFRYHAPAYMIDALTAGIAQLDDCEPDEWNGQNTIVFRLSDLTQSENDHSCCCLFNTDQRCCVARFLAFHLELNYIIGDDNALTALRNYWVQFLPEKDKAHFKSIWPDTLP